MTTMSMQNSSPALTAQAVQQMAEYGIKRISVDYFCYGQYGYADLTDAIAQAQRERRLVAETANDWLKPQWIRMWSETD
jgi:protoheme ferro-lyase